MAAFDSVLVYNWFLLNLSISGGVVVKLLASGARGHGFDPDLAITIFEIGYLLLYSRNMAERSLKRRKYSKQPTNQSFDFGVVNCWCLVIEVFLQYYQDNKSKTVKILINIFDTNDYIPHFQTSCPVLIPADIRLLRNILFPTFCLPLRLVVILARHPESIQHTNK